MNADQIVEVYSAGNIVEAESLVEVLEEAGVATRVVGDMLGYGTGWLPLTSAAPRVWVRQADEARARQIIATWSENLQAIVAEGAPDEELTEPMEADDEDREQPTEPEGLAEPSSPGSGRFRLVNRAIAIAGSASILAGTYFAMQNWLLLRQFSAKTEAQYVDYKMAGFERHAVADAPDRPGHVRLRAEYRATYRMFYAYEVDGKEYYAELTDGIRPPEVIIVHYDPNRPASNIVGPLTPPWVSLLLGTFVGGLLLFVAWRFR